MARNLARRWISLECGDGVASTNSHPHGLCPSKGPLVLPNPMIQEAGRDSQHMRGLDQHLGGIGWPNRALQARHPRYEPAHPSVGLHQAVGPGEYPQLPSW
jgi:hypothetical protein